MAGRIKQKSKVKKNVPSGIICIKATFNNTIVVVTDPNGDVIATASGGVAGFKGSRKSTPYAAQKAMEIALEKAMQFGLKTASIEVKGPGAGRDSAIRAISNFETLTVTSIKDVTPLPHNGCRPPKKKTI